MTRHWKLLVLPAALALASQSASAQTCSIASTSASVNCSVGTTLSMTMSTLMNMTLNGTTVTLNAPTAVSDFNVAGLYAVATTGPSFQVRSNRSYRVQVHADAATFAHTAVAGGATYNKPAADLSWANDAATFTTLTTTAADIGSGSSTSLSVAKTITYKTAYDITKDQPGAYTIGVTFTLVAP